MSDGAGPPEGRIGKGAKTLLAAAVPGWLAAWLVAAGTWTWIFYENAQFLPFAGKGTQDPVRVGLEGHEVAGGLATAAIFLAPLALYVLVQSIRGILGRCPAAHRGMVRGFRAVWILLLIAWFTHLGLYADLRTGELLVQGTERGDIVGHKLYYDGVVELWFYLPVAVLLLLAHIHATTARAYAAYGRAVDERLGAPGDNFLEDLRSNGPDPTFRRNEYRSLALHLLVLLLPFLLSLIPGCISYPPPPGAGRPTTPPTTAVKVVKKKKVLLAENSPYIFKTPEPDDSEVMKQIDQISERVYEASAAGAPGAVGTGDGEEGGFGGPPGGKFYFVRLQHRTRHWDDGMRTDSKSGNADRNFLKWYKNNPAVKFEVDTTPHAETAAALTTAKPGFAPQFVYVTGEEGIRLSSREYKHLRDYIDAGGMLIVDAGSRGFAKSIPGFARRLTGKPLVSIGTDDHLFRIPGNIEFYPLFDHGGRQAKGVKLKGRWVLFFHPGDMNDAWKDNAYRLPKKVRDNAKQVMYNVTWHAMKNYVEINKEHYAK